MRCISIIFLAHQNFAFIIDMTVTNNTNIEVGVKQTHLKSDLNARFQEYTETNDIHYLLFALRKAAEAKGWSALSRETGLSRSVLYAALSGETDPRIGTVMKILKALEIQVLTNIVPFPDKEADKGNRSAIETFHSRQKV
ncbi:MAG: putative addiction module antidote protein [Synergistaceae bacterium]|jgi:probable addiction module antidote protein|nr:putative addiction module antidote protein [Synergistaceae bacterium]